MNYKTYGAEAPTWTTAEMNCVSNRAAKAEKELVEVRAELGKMKVDLKTATDALMSCMYSARLPPTDSRDTLLARGAAAQEKVATNADEHFRALAHQPQATIWTRCAELERRELQVATNADEDEWVPSEEDLLKGMAKTAEHERKVNAETSYVPCPILQSRDDRWFLGSDKYKGIFVNDHFTHELIPIANFLDASECNIAINVGGLYYAYDRRTLCDYMRRKVTYIDSVVGHVYETPFGQCITDAGLQRLHYGDYTIFELVPSHCILNVTCTKTLFHIYCYSAKGWVNGKTSEFEKCPLNCYTFATADEYVRDKYSFKAETQRCRDRLIREKWDIQDSSTG